VVNKRGTIVGTQFQIQVMKLKKGRQDNEQWTHNYPVVSMAPILTKEDVENGTTLLDVVNVNQKGLLLAAPKSQSYDNDENVVDVDIEDVT
jgi:hypothetical protein